MRGVTIAGLAAMLIGGGLIGGGPIGSASAQRIVQPGPGASYPVPPRAPVAPPPGAQRGYEAYRGGYAPRAARWPMREGRWTAGWNAPGGWNAYRRPYRGWALPRYWAQPGFVVGDWSAYGLAQPPYGYSWSRYYDDAVLVDARGSVYDTVEGIDWDGAYAGYAYDDGYRRDDRRYRGRDDGLGGAAVGAVAGGVAGNVVAGRGHRLGGTLIGAGVGGAAGYAIDRNEDRGRRAPPPPRYGADYPPPPPVAPAYPPPPPVYAAPGDHWRSADGTTVVTTSAGGYGGGTTTTVVVQTAPVVTTTTEVYEDAVTYTRPAPRKAVRRWRRPGKTLCRCS